MILALYHLEFLVSSAKVPCKNYFSIWQQELQNSYCKLENHQKKRLEVAMEEWEHV